MRLPLLPWFVLAPVAVQAQGYESSSCEAYENRKLLGEIRQGAVAGLPMPEICGGGGNVAALASSSLRPTGKAPAIPQGPRPEEPEAGEKWAQAMERYDRWTCQYSAARAFDRDSASAWCEGRPGDGAGEMLVVPAEGTSAEIWVGLGRSEAAFRANGRPRRIRVYLLEAATGSPAQCGGSLGQISVVSTRELELEDRNGYQPLPLPPGKGTLVAIEILSVRPGSRSKDTCISEVRTAK